MYYSKNVHATPVNAVLWLRWKFPSYHFNLGYNSHLYQFCISFHPQFSHSSFLPLRLFSLLPWTPPSEFLSCRSSHGLAHTRRHPPPFFLSIPSLLAHFIYFIIFRAWSRHLLDVPVNTAGAVTVMYGCNPSSAAWHGCQLPRETRWFIFCGDAYGLI